jgi:3-isopropylmalate dehydrogenase
MKASIVLLPGDGIGPEVVEAAKAVLETISERFGHIFIFHEYLIGGCSIDSFGTPLAEETLKACKGSDAILLGAVGGPKWDDPDAKIRPEQGLLTLRKTLQVFANLRPVKPHPNLLSSSPLRSEYLADVDLMVVRELTGGIYFGEPRFRTVVNGEMLAKDTMVYTEGEIRRVANLAYWLARKRRKKVTSVDKANVLECSRLWRQVVTSVASDYPDVETEHILVDAAAMFLLKKPASFDVLLTANMFGDILTDEASVLTGSMGNLPSASLGKEGPGLYEPIHGSAPDIAGKGIANPIGSILSAALLLHHSLGLETEAIVIEEAVNLVLNAGYRTQDIGEDEGRLVDTKGMTKRVIEGVKSVA